MRRGRGGCGRRSAASRSPRSPARGTPQTSPAQYRAERRRGRNWVYNAGFGAQALRSSHAAHGRWTSRACRAVGRQNGTYRQRRGCRADRDGAGSTGRPARMTVITGSFELSPEQIRVLGCLLEKQRTTPDAYPLSLNSLRLACNQSTNRDPVVEYDEATIREALERLQRRGLTRLASGAGSRAAKYRHLLAEALPMDRAEEAVMCVLMLRGPQTPGELKQRGERMHAFADLADVLETLRAALRAGPRALARAPPRPEGGALHPAAGRRERGGDRRRRLAGRERAGRQRRRRGRAAGGDREPRSARRAARTRGRRAARAGGSGALGGRTAEERDGAAPTSACWPAPRTRRPASASRSPWRRGSSRSSRRACCRSCPATSRR